MIKLNYRKIIFFLVFLVMLAGLHFSGLITPIESRILSWGSYPVRKVYGWIALERQDFYNQKEKENCCAEKERLLKEKNKLLAENAQLKALEEENKELKKFLDFFEDKDYERIMARVISPGYSLNPEEKTPSVIIDKGKRDGLKKGLLVVDNQGIVLGKTNQVKESTSKVLLLTHHDSSLAASLQNRKETSGLLEGDLGLTMKMSFIPQTVEVSEGELVVTSGLEENIPAGSILGKVVSVKKSSNQMWQEAVIEPLIDLRGLSLVTVLIP